MLIPSHFPLSPQSALPSPPRSLIPRMGAGQSNDGHAEGDKQPSASPPRRRQGTGEAKAVPDDAVAIVSSSSSYPAMMRPPLLLSCCARTLATLSGRFCIIFGCIQLPRIVHCIRATSTATDIKKFPRQQQQQQRDDDGETLELPNPPLEHPPPGRLICVGAIIRPHTRKEAEGGFDPAVRLGMQGDIEVETRYGDSRRFTLDQSFGPRDAPRDVYVGIARAVVLSTLETGRGGCVIAHGPKSSGKTHNLFSSEGGGILRHACR